MIRFHIDGVRYNGHGNVQSTLEFQHAELTRGLLSGYSDQLPDFPENQLTEDEKCSLFFTLSHVVNVTALHNEEEAQVYWSIPQKTAKAPARDMGKEIVLTTEKPTTVKAVQSSFLTDDDAPSPAKGKKIKKRDTFGYV